MKSVVVVGIFALFLLNPVVLRATQTASAQPSATITGTVVYNGRAISEFTDRSAAFWTQNRTSGEVFPTNPNYNPSTGAYSIPNVPPGEYGIDVFLDVAEPLDGERGFPGDFDGFCVVTVPEGQSLVNEDLPVMRIIHLTAPVDNAVMHQWPSPGTLDTYSPDRVVFKWDAIPEATSFYATIHENRQTDTMNLVQKVETSKTDWEPSLPESQDNWFYVFDLRGRNSDGVDIAWLELAYETGYGWDYRFRVSTTPPTQTATTAASAAATGASTTSGVETKPPPGGEGKWPSVPDAYTVLGALVVVLVVVNVLILVRRRTKRKAIPEYAPTRPATTKYCINCGSQIPRTAKFCAECGAGQ